MSGFRLAGPMGAAFTSTIDSGTLVRNWSPIPRPLDFENTLAQMVRQKVRQGERLAVDLALRAACHVAIEELKKLENNVDLQFQYLAHLPAEIKKDVAYEVVGSFFDQPISKKMLRQYIFGKGSTLNLSEREMIDCNPYIDITRSANFRTSLVAATKTPGKDASIDFKLLGFALTNGTLGNFTVHVRGTLRAAPDGSWKVVGKMNFYDKYDFDPKDFETSGRSFQGELKTRFGHYFIPGDPYEVTSVDTEFSQTPSDKTVVWVGGAPKQRPDRVAALDAALSAMDK